MTQKPRQPNTFNRAEPNKKQTTPQSNTIQPTSQTNSEPQKEITDEIKDTITNLKNLKDYPIRDLVKHAEKFGPYLKNRRLETNQIRKFLDAINQLKARLAQDEGENGKVITAQNEAEKEKVEAEREKVRFAKIETDIVLLKPKLAYAAARQQAAKPLSDVMSAAIDQVKSSKDFERLVQLIESIIAYHKAEGGK
jgi:CRISPR-associated protein Csm2